MSNSVSNPLSDPVTDPLSIIVYSDVICPWCYVGKRRLEAALDGPDMRDLLVRIERQRLTC